MTGSPPTHVLSKAREVLNDEAQSPGDWHDLTVELAQALLAAQEREERLRYAARLVVEEWHWGTSDGPEETRLHDRIVALAGVMESYRA